MASSLSQLFSVLQRRGGTVVVYDSATDQSYLLQPLESTSSVAISSPVVTKSAAVKTVELTPTPADVRGLTEEQLLAKINRDIAVWRQEQAVRENGTSSDDTAGEFQLEPADDELTA